MGSMVGERGKREVEREKLMRGGMKEVCKEMVNLNIWIC